MSAPFFVIGDVHGCAEELRALLRKLPLGQDSTVLFLGDYVDRGPDSKGVIDTILDLSQVYRVIALKGNHEWLFAEYLAQPNDAAATSNFILNGGSNTLASYSSDGVTFQVPAAHRGFLEKLALYHDTPEHFFVHAGIPPDLDFARLASGAPLDEKTAYQFLWIRSHFLNSSVPWPKKVVHGHTPVSAPDVRAHRVNLDTGCVYGGRLTALDVASGEFYSVARNEVSAPRFLNAPFAGEGPKRAHRFVGEIMVEVEYGGQSFPFHTANFNEFGLLIFPLAASRHLQFAVGEKLSGLIKPGGALVFDFTATVMRTDSSRGAQGFGLKFDSLRNLRDLPHGP